MDLLKALCAKKCFKALTGEVNFSTFIHFSYLKLITKLVTPAYTRIASLKEV